MMIADLPFLGVGLNYEPPMHDQYLAHHDEIDYLELPTDAFLLRMRWDDEDGRTAWRDRAVEIAGAFPVVAHGIRMGLADAAPYRTSYLDRLEPFLDLIDPVWFSDHLDQGSVPDGAQRTELMHGIPIAFTAEQAQAVRRNMQTVTDRVRRPLLVENTWYDYMIKIPGAMDEPEFVRQVLDGTDHGLLLDLTNTWINAQNYGFDVDAWLAAAPLDRVVELHVAGGELRTRGPKAGTWHDSHSRPVPEQVWALVADVVVAAPVRAITLEWSNDVPPMPELLDQLNRARQLLHASPFYQNKRVAAPEGISHVTPGNAVRDR